MEFLLKHLLVVCMYVVVTNGETETNSISCFVDVLLESNGQPFCAEGEDKRIHPGNFDQDKRTDLLCHNKGLKTIEILFLASNTIKTQHLPFCSSPASQLYVGDFNGDGRDDLLCREYGEKLNFVYADDRGDYKEENIWKGSEHFCKEQSSTLHLGDLNGDGFTDMVCRLNSGGIAISYANDKGHFRSYSHIDMEWCPGNHSVLVLGDFNYDKKQDMLCHNSISGNMSIILSTESGSGIEPVALTDTEWCKGENHPFITVGDVNDDGFDDLICKDEGDFGITYIAPNHKQPPYFKEGNRFYSFCFNGGKKNFFVGDFNGDRRSDLLCQAKVGTRQVNIGMCSSGVHGHV